MKRINSFNFSMFSFDRESGVNIVAIFLRNFAGLSHCLTIDEVRSRMTEKWMGYAKNFVMNSFGFI